MALTGPNKYVITQLLGNGDLLQLHPRTDADIVLVKDLGNYYAGANVEAILASEVLNVSSTAQTKASNLTINGVEIGKLSTIPSVSFLGASYDKTIQLGVQTGQTGDLVFNLPNKASGTWILATTDDLPTLSTSSSILDNSYTDGVIKFDAYTTATAGKLSSSASPTAGTSNLTWSGTFNTNIINGTTINASGNVGGNTLTSVANTTVGGDLKVTGGIAVNNGGLATDKFTVSSAGAVYTTSTLDVDGAAGFESTITVDGIANLNGGIIVNGDDTTKFSVAETTGNVFTLGTLDVTGITTLDEDLIIKNSSGTTVFQVDDATGTISTTGNAIIDGNITVKGGNIFCANTDGSGTFNIGSANLNPVNATLNLGSQPILTGARTINIGTNGALGTDTTVNIGSALEDPNHSIINLYGKVNVIGGTGSVITTETLNVTDNEIVLNSNATAPVAGTSGIVINRGASSTYIDATLYWDETTQKWTVSNGLIVSGDISSTGAITSTGNFTVGTNALTVEASSGNTLTTGSLTVAGQTNLNGGLVLDTNKFVVADGTGNTEIAGTLEVDGVTTINNTLSVVGAHDVTFGRDLIVNRDLTVKRDTYLEGNFTVLNRSGDPETVTPKFIVDSENGNTIIAGTLSVDNSVIINGGAGQTFLINNGATPAVNKFTVDSTNGNTNIAGTLNVVGAVTGLSFNGLTIDSTTGTLDVLNGKTLAVDGSTTVGINSITLESTKSITLEHANLVVGDATGTGTVTIKSDSASVRSLTLENNVTIEGLPVNRVLVSDSTDTNVISSTDKLPVSLGGTGLSSYTAGDLIYASDTTTLSKLAAGTGNNGKVLTVSGGVPVWGSSSDALPDIVTAGTYSAVQVNQKGLVTAGGQFIEVGSLSGVNAPTSALASGGLFFLEITA
jgi:hypothetical protein